MIALALTTSVVRPLFSLDAAAASYIAAVTTAKGSSPTGVQIAAIDAFIVGEKTAGRWTSHKRIYLPIWGNAAANAIDLVTGTSGTWNGTVTHSAGYVASDGTTGYLNMGAAPDSLGATLGLSTLFVLRYVAATAIPIGCNSGGAVTAIECGGGSVTGYAHNTGVGKAVQTVALASQAGIAYLVRETATSMYMRLRRQAGVTSSVQTTDTNVTSPASQNIAMLCYNNDGAFNNFTTSQVGAGGFSIVPTIAAADAFTSNLKTLWETCTGLTLP